MEPRRSEIYALSTPVNNPSNPLWEFSLATYGRAGVPQECLALQGAHDADVNVVLCVLWLGKEGYRVARVDFFSMLDALVGDWHHNVVRSLRHVRRWMKVHEHPNPAASETLRDDIKRIEIEAERLEQERLYAFAISHLAALEKCEGGEVAMAENLAAYLGHLGAESSEAPDAAKRLVALSL